MKTIHAYKNKDNTWRVEAIASAWVDGSLADVIQKIPRAKITIEALLEKEEKYELFTLEIKENQHE